MNIIHNTAKVSRRHLLKGAGVAMALPLLDCMVPARGASEDAVRPRRSVFISLPDGVHVRAWQIADAGPNYRLSRSLAPLEKHRTRITPISGLHHTDGGHAPHAFLTGGRTGRRHGISIDQVMVQAIDGQTRFPSLEIGGDAHSYNSDGIQLPTERSPGPIFERLFTEPAGGTARQRRNLERRGSVLDAVLDDARSFGSQLGQQDRGRLEDYLNSVREVEIRVVRANRWLDRPRPQVTPEQATRLNRSPSAAGGLGEYMRLMYDIIVLAFQTDVTRVVSFSTGQENSGSFSPEIGITTGRHSLSHKQNEELVRSDIYNVELFSGFLDRLVEVRDAGGPLIDTTMALFGSHMSNGSSHVSANLPFVLAGGTALGLRHGSHIDFNAVGNPQFTYELDNERSQRLGTICRVPVNRRAPHSNLLLAMAQKMGVRIDRFNNSTGTIADVVR
ncbi:MAG: DUF1552 domain-containing protein [Planctomycetota bacterium]